MSENENKKRKEKTVEKAPVNFNLKDKQEAQLWEYLNRVSDNHSQYFKRLLYLEMRTNPNGDGSFYPVGPVPQTQREQEPEPEEEKENFSADDLGGIVG
ncbi:hypothetical protein ACFO25_09850 [Paenactinomyces guangxiensis]|uniref:Uncharacterized protein n=1 Tax=Paenactinomyces guangxiensis TaxID=1490290 RepID=A0A7W1WS52_9BACL|nr:hypothetical protein [Paenactinomyces guangxiensis]MBA4495087.1 hypothetical protein [Paenactinomyces guangxiensis]MBH8592229.1 hypothetical protein [Paenactinomyces guangxiensis]